MSSPVDAMLSLLLSISETATDLAVKKSSAAMREQDPEARARLIGAAEAYVDMGKRLNDGIKAGIAAVKR